MTPEELIRSVNLKREQLAEKPDPDQEFTKEQFNSLISAVEESNKLLVKFLLNHEPKVDVKNFPDFPKSISTPDSKDIVKAVNNLESALKPSEYDNSEVVLAIRELKESYDAWDEALAKLDMKPVVNVDAPVVKIDKPDFKPIIKALENNKPEPVDFSGLTKLMQDNITATKKVSDTLNKLKFPVANVPTDPLIYYLPSDIDDVPAIQYFGYTDNRGAWYIKKYDTASSPKTIRLAFGQSNYASAWTNRAAQTYVIWGS